MLRLPNEWVARLRPAFDGRRVCVTGGAGFIGGHLVDALLSLGATIAVIDDLSNSTAEHVAGLIDLEPERVRFVHGSILDPSAVRDALESAQVVFHLAALASVPRSLADPRRTWSVNAEGTVRVLEAARAAGVQRVVYSASSSAYGGSTKLPKTETDLPDPLSPYAASKLAGEHAVRAWSRSFDLPAVSLRYFNVFGPRQPADSPYSGVVALFARKMLAGETPVIFGDGNHTRDFTPVASAVLANLLAGSVDRPFRGEVVNVGTGMRITLGDLATRLGQLCGMPHVLPIHQPERPGDVRHSLADLTLARQLLGYEPVADTWTALAETVEWYRSTMAGRGDAV